MRRRMSNSDRAEFFRDRKGKCHLCGGKIQVGEAWEVEHVIPLAMGGADDDSNRMLAHRKCHSRKTATCDVPAIARAKRRERAHIGARKSRNPLPCGRRSAWKKKISGEIVRRST